MKINKIIIAPDSYKETATSSEVADAIEAGILKVLPDAEIIKVPIADGGEGTVEALGADIVRTNVTDPFFNITESFWGILGKGTAVIEVAAAAGISQAQGNKNPEVTTSYGVGDLIYEAVSRGYKNIIIGLGGSCTNDGGSGIAASLGVRFIDNGGNIFIPTGGSLCNIEMIDVSGIIPEMNDVKITAICDVNNPLCGENGASKVFGPQKGADAAMAERLDAGLAHYAKIVNRDVGCDILNMKSGGAAGGIAAGLKAFFNADIKSGIDAVLEAKNFDEMLENADLIITGEGKFDGQTKEGKAISGIAKKAKEKNIPVAVIAGMSDIDSQEDIGIIAVYKTRDAFTDIESIKKTVKTDITQTAEKAIKGLLTMQI